jgi:hypothetical protein
MSAVHEWGFHGLNPLTSSLTAYHGGRQDGYKIIAQCLLYMIEVVRIYNPFAAQLLYTLYAI